MTIIYNVTIEPTEKQNHFHITWHNIETNTKDFFDQTVDMTQEEVKILWRMPGHQLAIGEKLFYFLDGDSRHLQQALNQADQKGQSLQVNLRTCKQINNWPFELLARDGIFLLPHKLHLVRCVSNWGIQKKTIPQNRPLKLLFMACSAIDVEPTLYFEREEEAIFHITRDLTIEMEVEDSGSLQGLRQQLEREQYDVVHMSCHANINKQGRPYIIMENETGYQQKIFPEQLWQEALIENPPRLLFLSGSRTGEAPVTPDTLDTTNRHDSSAAVSFARLLVESDQVPAVLGWGRSVSDEQAIHAGEMFYHELSRGKSILDALQRTRYELIKDFSSDPNPSWPLLHLFSSGMELNVIVQEGQQLQPKPRQMKHVFLEQSQVQVLAEGFVGRRRQLQTSLRVLKQDFKKVGILLLGTGGLGKSCLAGKISERFPRHTLIIVHGKLNAITLEAAIEDAFIAAQNETGKHILSQKKEMTEKLANLCAATFKEKHYLLLLDDFEQNLEGTDKGQPGSLLPEAAELMRVLLHYLPFSGKMTQLIITSRYWFSLTEQGRDLVKEQLEAVWLTSFQESEQLKKARELKHMLNYPDQLLVKRLLAAGHGNPRLMEFLDLLVGRMAAADVSRLLEAVRDKQEDFIRDHVIRELLLSGGEELTRFLSWLSIYRRPVLEEGVQKVAEKAGLSNSKELLQEGMRLSLVEHDQVRKSYQVTPLLREELLKDLEDQQSCHETAFAYYSKVCEALEVLDPLLVEEWIFHALHCGREDVASHQGARLVKHLRERLAFQQSRRVGEWILAKKKRECSTGGDAFLLNELAYTIEDLGDHLKAIQYYEQALSIDRSVYGELHSKVAIRLNNLGSAWDALGDNRQAISYYEQALSIFKKVYGEKHPNVASTLNNLGSAWKALGGHRKAIEYFEQALSIDRSFYGKLHSNVARELNNLGSAWKALGDLCQAISYYKQALSIDQAVYGEAHPNVGIVLNNLGSTYFDLGKIQEAKDYFHKAYAIFNKIFGPGHPYTKTAASRLGKGK